jgi:hypothetical protein
MSMATALGTALRRRFGALWRALACGLAYAVSLFALVVQAPALAPWTDEPR